MAANPLQIFPTLTRATCECCGDTFVDEAGALLVWDAVAAYRDALLENAEHDRAVWAEAERATQAALAAAARAEKG